MIKSISIKNFQSHKSTELEFAPGINGIVGISQSGKTAILRAFNLLANNRPQGARYFNNQADVKEPCTVEVILNSGEKIILTKIMTEAKDGKISLKETFYELNGEKWKGSQTVPDKILQVLNLGELNFQSQLDPPFLVTSSSGEIAKTINRVTHLEQVDEFVSDLSKKIGGFSREIKFKEIERDKIEDSVANLPDIPKVEKYINRLDVLSRKKKALDAEETSLLGFIDDLEECREKLKEAEEISARISSVEKKIVRHEKLAEKRESLLQDQQLVEGYIFLVARNRKKTENLKRLKKELEELLSQQEICPTCETPLNIQQLIKRSFQ